MGHVMCLIFGHQKARVVFASNRFYCSRCRKDLGQAESTAHVPPQTTMPRTTVRKFTKQPRAR
jgi:hypothetical protein